MSEKPDLVRLLHRADWTRLSLAAAVSASEDPSRDPGWGPGRGAARAAAWDVAVVLAARRVLGHALLRVARGVRGLG
jgi:hypothetical protein